ncbi:DUF3951 domain-containing protein [Microbacteriaceae bacterium 4G12]
MNILLILTAIFTFFIILTVGLISYRLFVKKQSVNNYYTPFDYIASQSNVQFHEEQEEQEDHDEEGDNLKKG